MLIEGPIVSTLGTMKRRKPRGERKETSVRIRLTGEQKRALTTAATQAGLDLSGWIRFIALREAGRAQAGRVV